MDSLIFQGVFISSSKTEKYTLVKKLSDLISRGEIYQYIYSWVLFIERKNSDKFIMLSGAFSGDFIDNFRKLKWKLSGDQTSSTDAVDYFVEDGIIKVRMDEKTISSIWFDKYEKVLREIYTKPDTKRKITNEFLYFPWTNER